MQNCFSASIFATNPDSLGQHIVQVSLRHKVVYLAGYLDYQYGDGPGMVEMIGDEGGNEVSSVPR